MTVEQLRDPCQTGGCRDVVEVRTQVALLLPQMQTQLQATQQGVSAILTRLEQRDAAVAARALEDARTQERQEWERWLWRWAIRLLLMLVCTVIAVHWSAAAALAAAVIAKLVKG